MRHFFYQSLPVKGAIALGKKIVLCPGVAVCRSCDVGELRCAEVAVWESQRVGELQSRIVAGWGISCVGELQCGVPLVFHKKLFISKSICLRSFCNSPLKRYFSKQIFYAIINLGPSSLPTHLNFPTALKAHNYSTLLKKSKKFLPFF